MLKHSTVFSAILALAPRKSFDEPEGQQQTPPASTKTFGEEYVKELREEAKSYRVRMQEAEAAKKAAEDAATAAKTDADTRVSAAEKAANDRLLRAELKAAAIKAGIQDLDGLKLADISNLKLNDQGEVEGVDAFIDEFKKAKPYLFTATASSGSSAAKPPAKAENEPVDVRKMSKEEYAKYKAKRGL